MNVWQLAEYTMMVSVVALLLLAMKRLFHDKLDARWHYLIWAVLAVRMVVPLDLEWLKAPLSLFRGVPVEYWVRYWSVKAERAGMSGVMEALLSWYFAGAGLLGIYYLVIALVVRVKVLRLPKAEQSVLERTEEIALRYGLKPCKRVRISKMDGAFVSGLLRPILVLPAETAAEDIAAKQSAAKGNIAEEVIVHELLHQKHGDVLINYVLHLVRVVQWFNPLIWYVTATILNDSEALCDQRVLEQMQKLREENGKNCSEMMDLQELDANQLVCVEDVQENLHKKDCEKFKNSIEKKYGMLLIDMAEAKGLRSARIGTTNMANSAKSMRTRIRRIADFKRVPEGIGFAALCITLILAASGVSNAETKNILSCGAVTEADMEHLMTRALTYEAETKEEALYLYIQALQGMNPIYMLPVLPEDELAAYEDWMHEMYNQEKYMVVVGYDDDKAYLGATEDMLHKEIPRWISYDALSEELKDNPWFTHEGLKMTACSVYNLEGQPVLKFFLQEGDGKYVTQQLELLYENGWKVRKLSEEVHLKKQEPEPMLYTTGQQGEWKVEVKGWDEGYFPEVVTGMFNEDFGSDGVNPFGVLDNYSGAAYEARELEERAEYPEDFTMSYKYIRIDATYLGQELSQRGEADSEEGAASRFVSFETILFSKEEWLEQGEAMLQAERQKLYATDVSAGHASREDIGQEASGQEYYVRTESGEYLLQTESGDYSMEEFENMTDAKLPEGRTHHGRHTIDSPGWYWLEASEITPGEPIQLEWHGSGYQTWEPDEEIHFITKIYYDDVCVEVLGK